MMIGCLIMPSCIVKSVGQAGFSNTRVVYMCTIIVMLDQMPYKNNNTRWRQHLFWSFSAPVKDVASKRFSLWCIH